MVGRAAEAVPFGEEAVLLHSELVEVNRDAYLYNLVNSMGTAGHALVEAGDYLTAVDALATALLLVVNLPDTAASLTRVIVWLLQRAYAANPTAVAERFTETTGIAVPDQIKQPP